VRSLAILAALAASASANVWKDAADLGSQAKKEAYDDAMRAGDEAAKSGMVRGASIPTTRKFLDAADKAYRQAAAARPDAAEPWYRIGKVVYTYVFDCEAFPANFDIWVSPLCGTFDRKRAAEVVEAWDEFEKRSPLDPRLTMILGRSHLLFERAILNTKLVTISDVKANKMRLEAAARDYEEMIKRTNVADDTSEPVRENLAETYMMLDRLDDAVDMYKEALRRGASIETQFGLAVALDRDDRGDEAADLVNRLGPTAVEEFKLRVIRQFTFFVPDGEQFYYFALIDESLGQFDTAIEYWKLYIKSGAHPEFQPRAKQHLDALVAKRPKHPQPRLKDFDDELPFQP